MKIICECGRKTRGFAKFCWKCGKALKTSGQINFKELDEFFAWEGIFCDGGDRERHRLQDAPENIFCPSCGRKI